MELNISASAKKLKTAEDSSVPEDPSIGYKILNFFTVFSALSERMKCKTCGGVVKFTTDSTRGLGFKITISCSSCEPISIPSCPYVHTTAYEINQRFFCYAFIGNWFEWINEILWNYGFAAAG